MTQDLEEWLQYLDLADRLQDVFEWCDEQGVKFLEEVVENIDDLSEALRLPAEEAARVAAGARTALCKAHPAALEGTSTGSSPSKLPVGSAASRQSLRTLSVPFPGGQADVGATMSAKERVQRTLTFAAGVNKAQNKFRSLSGKLKPLDEEEEAPAKEQPGLASLPERTATVSMTGPLAGLFGAMQVGDGEMCMSQMTAKSCFKNEEAVLEPGTPATQQARAAAKAGGLRPVLTRRDTVGKVLPGGKTNREALMEQVHEDGAHPVNLDAGQTGTVYALEVGGEKIAVFKPAQGEQFSRKSVPTGQGCIREEAAYLVDRLSDSRAGVPVTSRASIEVDGKTLEGSVQKFVGDVIGFIEDFAMPRDPERAEEFVRQEDAEALALLDMRVLNMDRHTGNLLLLRREKPHGLGPIDHGCCLPPWWMLGEAIYDAWIDWVQFKSPPKETTRRLAAYAHENMEMTMKLLREVGLPEECIVTLQVCTLLVKVAIADLAIPVVRVAKLILRDEDSGFAELSWLETNVLDAAAKAGAKCRMGEDDRGDQAIDVDDRGEGLDVKAFLADLEKAFRKEVPKATEWCAAPVPLELLEAMAKQVEAAAKAAAEAEAAVAAAGAEAEPPKAKQPWRPKPRPDDKAAEAMAAEAPAEVEAAAPELDPEARPKPSKRW